MKEPQKSVTTVQTIIIPEEYLRLVLCRHFGMPDDSTLIIEEGEIILSQTILIPEEYLHLVLCRHFGMPDDSTLIIEEGKIILSHASVTRNDF